MFMKGRLLDVYDTFTFNYSLNNFEKSIPTSIRHNLYETEMYFPLHTKINLNDYVIFFCFNSFLQFRMAFFSANCPFCANCIFLTLLLKINFIINDLYEKKI